MVNPVYRLNVIISNVKKRGYTKEVSRAVLREEIIKSTYILNEKKIERVIDILNQFGYLRKISSNTYELCDQAELKN